MLKIKQAAILIMLAVSSNAFSAEHYDPSKNYSAGSEVYFNEKIFEAQWWANPGDSPAKITENSWESPWIFVRNATSSDSNTGNGSGGQASGGTTGPGPGPGPTTSPADPPVEGAYPAYQEGTKYKGGDVVQVGDSLYRCMEGVTSGWCSGASWAYGPGTGTAWTNAWELVSEADLTVPEQDIPTPPGTGVIPPKPTEPDVPVSPGGTVSGNKYVIKQSELDAKEAQLTDFPVMVEVKETIRTLDNDAVERIAPKAATNPDNVKRAERIVSENDWNYMFSMRAPEYTYTNFLKAIGKFPGFCKSYNDGRDADAICRKALATMFAHFTQETGGHSSHEPIPEWRQGLVHVREMGCDNPGDCGYNGECNPDVWQGQTWPCGKNEEGEFLDYFGRGAKQLSYNYNYGPFSDAMFGTVRTLLDDPDRVADTWLNLASAVFFFMYPQPPKPSMMHVLDGTWQPNDRDISNNLTPGFGVTTQIINGGVECGGSVEVAQSVNRIDYYENFADYLGVNIPDDEVLGCKGMKSFDADGSGAVNIYWEQDWGWSPDTPDGSTYSCQLVGYQTPYSAFKEGDYTKCVEAKFPNVEVIENE